VTLTTATAVAVMITATPATAQDRCNLPAAPTWTPTETTIWHQLCAGHTADLNPTDHTLDPTKPDGWNNRQTVSSTFIEHLLTAPYATLIHRHGIRLRGAWFPNGLDISEATLNFPLRCNACRINNLQADHTVINGTLDLDGSAIEGDISLLGADIRGDLEMQNGSVVTGTLDAERLKVTGDVFLDERPKFRDISLFGADVGGLIYLDGSNWQPDGSLDLRQAHAGGIFTDDRADSWPTTIKLNGFVFQQWANPDPRTLGSDWFINTWLARLDTLAPAPTTSSQQSWTPQATQPSPRISAINAATLNVSGFLGVILSVGATSCTGWYSATGFVRGGQQDGSSSFG
jgi:hypothetical protein